MCSVVLWPARCVAQDSRITDKAVIRVLSAVGMRQVISVLGPEFERATGSKLNISYDSGALIERRIRNGEAADVVLLPRASIDRLLTEGTIRNDSNRDIATSIIGIAIRKDSPKPDISSVEAFKKTLLSANTIACPDPAMGGSSGVYIARLFERLGIAEAIKKKLVLVDTPGQEATMPGYLVAEGKAEIALHQMQELMAVPGIEILGPLPVDVQTTFLFSAAITDNAKNPAAGRSFLRFLLSRKARAVIKARGMKPVIP